MKTVRRRSEESLSLDLDWILFPSWIRDKMLERKCGFDDRWPKDCSKVDQH